MIVTKATYFDCNTRLPSLQLIQINLNTALKVIVLVNMYRGCVIKNNPQEN